MDILGSAVVSAKRVLRAVSGQNALSCVDRFAVVASKKHRSNRIENIGSTLHYPTGLVW